MIIGGSVTLCRDLHRTIQELYGTVSSLSRESKMSRVSSCSRGEIEFGLSDGSLALPKISQIFWSLLKAIIGGLGNFSVSFLPSIRNQCLVLCVSPGD